MSKYNNTTFIALFFILRALWKVLKKNQFVRCKPICWKHFLYFHKILYVYRLPILYNKGRPLPIMLNDSYLSNIIRTWNCSKFWLFFITKVSFISLVLSDVKKFRIGFTSSVITFPYCNYSKKYIGNIFQQFAMQDLFPLKLHSHNFFFPIGPMKSKEAGGKGLYKSFQREWRITSTPVRREQSSSQNFVH